MALKMFKTSKARANPADKQLTRHLADGPVCQVMAEAIYTDAVGHRQRGQLELGFGHALQWDGNSGIPLERDPRSAG